MVRGMGCGSPPVYVVYYGGDNPKANTALKLVRLGLACRAKRPPVGSLVLDPFSPTPISPLDRGVVGSRGVVVVDASWRRLRLPGWRRVVRRRLPLLVAGNPVNYGKPFLLSSAEAVAAALYIAGFHEAAERVLSVFKWGEAFFSVNRALLDAYSEACGAACVVKAECRLLREKYGVDVGECSVDRLARFYRGVVEGYVRRGV